MHDCALEPKSGKGLPSAPRVEHPGHCLEISTKTTLQNHIKIKQFVQKPPQKKKIGYSFVFYSFALIMELFSKTRLII